MQQEVRKVTKQIFDWGVQRGKLRHNPADKTVKAKQKKRRAYIPDAALADVLGMMERDGGHRATHNGLMNRAFVELLYLTGQRAQDIRLLKWTDVKEGQIAFQPSKTEDSSGLRVTFELTPELQRVLDSIQAFVRDRNADLVKRAAAEDAKRRTGKRAKSVPAPVEPVYVIHRLDGKPFQQTGVRAAWRRAIALTNYAASGWTLKDIRPKTLTDIYKITGDMRDAQKVAAHASLTTTEGYMRNKVAPEVVTPLVVPSRRT